LTPTPEQNAPEERAGPRISVVIVSFHRIEQLRAGLQSLGTEHQVVVVDNGSSGVAEVAMEFPHVRWSRLPKNFGLTKSLNIGIRASEGEHILLLHDDVLITADAVSQLADYLDAHSDAGAVCPLLTDASGSPGPQVSPAPSASDPDPALAAPPAGSETSAACVSGAAIMFRSFFLRAIRQIDERYGNFGSSFELCWQVRRASKKLVVLHSVTAIHEISASPMSRGALAGDRAAGIAAYLGKHEGFAGGLLYRIKTALAALFTLRFSVLAGVLSGQKIDGTG
jgi:GT2 family glycosyltransferase